MASLNKKQMRNAIKNELGQSFRIKGMRPNFVQIDAITADLMKSGYSLKKILRAIRQTFLELDHIPHSKEILKRINETPLGHNNGQQEFNFA